MKARKRELNNDDREVSEGILTLTEKRIEESF